MLDRLNRAYACYRDDGLTGLCTAVAGYLRWLIEFGLLARLVDIYVQLNGGQIKKDGLTFDVSKAPIKRGTRYRILRGSYEHEERRLVADHLDSDLDVIELGGGMGFVACHANRLLAPGRNHVVVEANVNLLPTLKRNHALNNCSFEIVHAAYAPGQTTVTFDSASHFESGQVAADQETGGVTVNATSLESLAETFELDEYAIIADVEGSERHFTASELDHIADRCQLLIVECHFDSAERSEFLETLATRGFELLDTRGDVVALKRPR